MASCWFDQLTPQDVSRYCQQLKPPTKEILQKFGKVNSTVFSDSEADACLASFFEIFAIGFIHFNNAKRETFQVAEMYRLMCRHYHVVPDSQFLNIVNNWTITTRGFNELQPEPIQQGPGRLRYCLRTISNMIQVNYANPFPGNKKWAEHLANATECMIKDFLITLDAPYRKKHESEKVGRMSQKKVLDPLYSRTKPQRQIKPKLKQQEQVTTPQLNVLPIPTPAFDPQLLNNSLQQNFGLPMNMENFQNIFQQLMPFLNFNTVPKPNGSGSSSN